MDDDTRRKIDPDLKYTWMGNNRTYPRDYPTAAESNALKIFALMLGVRKMERTTNAFDFFLHDRAYPQELRSAKHPPDIYLCGLVVIVTADAFELRLPRIEWVSVHTPAMNSRFWKRVPVKEIKSDDELKSLLIAGMDARRAEFTICRFCGHHAPPEHRHEADVCDGCAEKHLGIIH